MAVKTPIYLDNHSTTPLDPRVLEAMMPYLTADFGNAASKNHVFGWRAEEAVEAAREQVARLVNAASPREIVWTSGATESDNLALKGVAEAYRDLGRHLVTTAIEHKAVLDTCRRLGREGFEVAVLPVSPDGLVDPGDVAQAITDRTILVSVMLANNEVGTIQPVGEIGRVCRGRGVLFHCDAVQGAGKIPFDVQAMAVDLASVSAHKMNGPKGVGALYVRKDRPRVRLAPLIDGGGHEYGMRSGTLNVPAIVGFGRAAAIALAEGAAESERVLGLRERLRTALERRVPGLHLNGSRDRRLPGNLNVSVDGVEAEALMLAMREVAVSSGAACTSATLEPSHVLRAMGQSSERANASIRFGLGRFNTAEEVEYVVERVVAGVEKLRAMDPRLGAAPAGEPRQA